jgi:hypothetical protein
MTVDESLAAAAPPATNGTPAVASAIKLVPTPETPRDGLFVIQDVPVNSKGASGGPLRPLGVVAEQTCSIDPVA